MIYDLEKHERNWLEIKKEINDWFVALISRLISYEIKVLEFLHKSV